MKEEVFGISYKGFGIQLQIQATAKLK